jgi:hypothetical protein
MSSLLPIKLPYREHLVGSANRCTDHSPDLHTCAVPADGHPPTTASSLSSDPLIPSSGNHFHIAITNHAGGKIDVGSLPAMVTAPHKSVPGLLPTPAPDQRSISHLGYDGLRRTLATKKARTSTPSEHPALADQSSRVSFSAVSCAPKPRVTYGSTTSAKRRERVRRRANQAAANSIPAPPPDEQISEILTAVASIRKELHDTRAPPAPPRLPSPDGSRLFLQSTPAWPPQDTPISDANLRIAMTPGFPPPLCAISSMPPRPWIPYVQRPDSR